VASAVNAARDGAASAIRAVVDGERLATITPEPPSQQRGITFQQLRPRGRRQLRKLAQQLGDGQLEIPIAASHRLADAAQALAHATGAVPLNPLVDLSGVRKQLVTFPHSHRMDLGSPSPPVLALGKTSRR
jgi:hypothetical protein